jgi:hypothetical protein
MGPHPHFTSPIAWHTQLADALADARALGRRVFAVHGRATCGGTRALVERTLSKEELRDYLAQHFVALASDADRAEPELATLVAGLPRREPTPVCLYLAPDGRVLFSTAGGRPPAVLLNDMLEAVSKRL